MQFGLIWVQADTPIKYKKNAMKNMQLLSSVNMITLWGGVVHWIRIFLCLALARLRDFSSSLCGRLSLGDWGKRWWERTREGGSLQTNYWFNFWQRHLTGWILIRVALSQWTIVCPQALPFSFLLVPHHNPPNRAGYAQATLAPTVTIKIFSLWLVK